MGVPDYKKELESSFLNEKEPVGKKLCKINKFIGTVEESLKSASEQEKDDYIASIQLDENSDYLIKKTKLQMANILKRPGHVFEIFTSEDTILLQSALKLEWIFTSSSESPLISDPDFLVKTLFPKMSYSCRKKVATQMGKLCVKQDAGNITKIFRNIEETYGMQLARFLIASCDQITIDSVIMEKKTKLGHSQILKIYKNYPESVIKYLNELYEELKKSSTIHNVANWGQFFTSSDSCSCILRLIAKDRPADFMTLFEAFDSVISHNLSFGRRLTRLLINYDKKRIISNSQKYSKLLNQEELIKRLDEEEAYNFLLKLMPRNISQFQEVFEIGKERFNPLYSWLEKYSPEKRFEKLDNAFQATYNGKKLLDFPEFVSARVLLMLKPEMRDKWVDFRLSQKVPMNSYLYHATAVHEVIIGHIPSHLNGYWQAFRTTDKSIPCIKQYLSTEADSHQRADLVASLVITCSINKDLASLKEICQFVSARYRNDNPEVRLEFLKMISAHFDLLKLEEEHWKSINELLHISSINNEFSFGVQLLETTLEKSIHFRIKRDLPVDTQIQHYIKLKSRGYCTGESWCVCTSDPVLERKCLKLFAEHLGSMFPLSTACPSDSSVTSAIISLFESFVGWNKRRHNHIKKSGNKQMDFLSASEYQWLMKRLNDVLHSYHEGNKMRVIRALNYDQLASKILLPVALKKCPDPSIVIKFMKTDPQKLDEFSDDIIDSILACKIKHYWKIALTKFRKAGLAKLSEKYVNKCLQIAEDEEESLKERCNSIFIASFLLSPINFVSWITKFYPTEDASKLETYSPDEFGIIYGLRKMITQCLSNLNIPSAALPALSQFCKGDYLKLVVGSLHSVILKSPVTQNIMDFLQDLSKRPVSIKKHAIRLVVTISAKKENIVYLRNLWETEKHHSIRTIIFNRIFEFFTHNSSEESWELLTFAVNSLTSNDHPFLRDLGSRQFINSPGMPNDKFSDYLKSAFDKLQSLEETIPSELNISWIKVDLLQCIVPGNIQHVQEPFVEFLLDKHLFVMSEDTGLQSSAVSLAINYLLYYPKSTKKIQVVTRMIERLMGPAWNNLSKDSQTNFTARQALSYFVEQLSIESFKIGISADETLKNANMEEIFTRLQESLKSYREVCQYFSDYLFLNFSIIFHAQAETTIENLKSIGNEIGKFVDQVAVTYKPEVVSIISEILRRFISLCYKNRLMDDGVVNGTKIIFIVEGIFESTGSIDTQIVASQILFTANPSSIPPKGHSLEDKYADLVRKMRDVKDETVQIFLNYRLTQNQCKLRGNYDEWGILV